MARTKVCSVVYEVAVDDDRTSTNPQTSRKNGRHVKVGVWRQVLPFLAILLCTTASIVVWTLQLRGYKDDFALYRLVDIYRPTVQFLIHIASSLLTVAWTYAVCSSFNLLTRSTFAKRAVKLNVLRLWASISRASLDTNLPVGLFVLCACFCSIAIVPGWLWTGALTPQSVLSLSDGNLTTPKTGIGSYDFLQPRGTGNLWDGCWVTQQANGTFNSCPAFYQSANMIQSAASASTVDGSPRNHSKNDNSAYTYTGRSYGVGSSVGLTVSPPITETLQSYNYTEIGYLTSATCIYNRTSKWTLSDIMHDTQDGASPNIWYAQGFFPNSNWTEIYANKLKNSVFTGWDYYSQITLGRTPSKIVSIGSAKSDNVTDYYIAIAAGSNYTALNKIQCQFFFHPTVFSINVSTITNTIRAIPLADAPDDDPEPRGTLRAKVLAALGTLSMVQTTLYESTVGAALTNNVQNLLARTTGKLGGSNGTEAQVLVAVQDSMLAMVDDVLGSLAAAALTRGANATESRAAQFTALAIKIGGPRFVLGTVLVNLAGFIFVAGSATYLLLSRSQATVFDYTDLAALSLSVGIGSRCTRGEDMEDCAGELREWDGDSDDSVIEKLTAKLGCAWGGTVPAVTLHVA